MAAQKPAGLAHIHLPVKDKELTFQLTDCQPISGCSASFLQYSYLAGRIAQAAFCTCTFSPNPIKFYFPLSLLHHLSTQQAI